MKTIVTISLWAFAIVNVLAIFFGVFENSPVIWVTAIAVFAIVASAIFFTSKCAVPEKEIWLTEIFGRFEQELEPGWHFLLPFGIERVTKKVFTGKQMLRLTLDKTKSGDVDLRDCSLGVTVCFYYRIVNSYKLAYDIGKNFSEELKAIVGSSIRNYLALYELDEAIETKGKFTDRIIACQVNLILNPDTIIIDYEYDNSEFSKSLESLGIVSEGLVIEDFTLPDAVVTQREKSLVAREEKEAAEINREKAEIDNEMAIKKGETDKQIAVLKAEGDAASMEKILKVLEAGGQSVDYLREMEKWKAIGQSNSGDKVIVVENGSNQVGNGVKFGVGSGAAGN